VRGGELCAARSCCCSEPPPEARRGAGAGEPADTTKPPPSARRDADGGASWSARPCSRRSGDRGSRTGGTGLIGSVPLVLECKASGPVGPEGADAGCPGDRRRGHRPALRRRRDPLAGAAFDPRVGSGTYPAGPRRQRHQHERRAPRPARPPRRARRTSTRSQEALRQSQSRVPRPPTWATTPPVCGHRQTTRSRSASGPSGWVLGCSGHSGHVRHRCSKAASCTCSVMCRTACHGSSWLSPSHRPVPMPSVSRSTASGPSMSSWRSRRTRPG
jgi:hypothetical protein